jgi:hypothetical protein
MLYSFVVAGGWDKLASWALWGFMPNSKCVSPTFCGLNNLQSQNHYHDEECQVGGSDDHDATSNRSKPGQHNKNGNPIMTVIDWSGVHEIGVSWCCCPGAPKHDMQLMMAGLFPATFHNPKTAFMFWVLEDYHLDNLECKTTPSQFFSCLRRLTNNEFPNTVPVG